MHGADSFCCCWEEPQPPLAKVRESYLPGLSTAPASCLGQHMRGARPSLPACPTLCPYTWPLSLSAPRNHPCGLFGRMGRSCILISYDITRIKVRLKITCFPPSSICIPARAFSLVLPSFLNPSTLLLSSKYLPVTRKCLGTEEQRKGRARSRRQQPALPTLGGGSSRDRAAAQSGDRACFSMGCRRTDAEASPSTLASLFSSLPSPPPARSMHSAPQPPSRSHPTGRGHEGEDGKPGGIHRAFRAGRAGRLETIQFSRSCSQGRE